MKKTRIILSNAPNTMNLHLHSVFVPENRPRIVFWYCLWCVSPVNAFTDEQQIWSRSFIHKDNDPYNSVFCCKECEKQFDLLCGDDKAQFCEDILDQIIRLPLWSRKMDVQWN